jgi:hypothetical protein
MLKHKQQRFMCLPLSLEGVGMCPTKIGGKDLTTLVAIL